MNQKYPTNIKISSFIGDLVNLFSNIQNDSKIFLYILLMNKLTKRIKNFKVIYIKLMSKRK